MLARWLLLGLAFELLLAGSIGLWAARGSDHGAVCAVVAAAGAMLGWRIALIATTFALAWRWRSPRPAGARIGPIATLRMMIEEVLAFAVLYAVLQPFERAWLGADRLRRLGPREEPVVLIHGYLCNRGVWWSLRGRLESAGRCVATLNLEPPFGSIDAFAEQLAARIEQVLAATGAQRVALVGHSMGGLVARAYLARHGDARVARLITLGSPHRATRMARTGFGRNAAQMRPEADWLRALEAVALPAGLPASVLYSLHDNFVMPQAEQRLDGAENVPLAGIGHLALLHSRTVQRRVVERLAAPVARPTGT